MLHFRLAGPKSCAIFTMIAAHHATTLWRYRDLLRSLVARDLRVKYKGSSLGFVWSLLHPLVMIAVYTIAFKFIVKIPIENFPVFLLSGLLPWIFTSSALSAATGTIADNGSLVRKVAFPRAILPLGAVASQFVQFALTYGTVLLAFAVTGVSRSPAALVVIPLAVLQLAFTAGLGLMLATAYVYFRDTRHLFEVFLQVWFWLTPIVYSLTLVPAEYQRWFLLNPMTLFVTTYQRALLEQTLPGAAVIVTLVALATASLATGLTIFVRFERRFAELV
jgi:ABC-type polysaccharide/polyol phosphate export permease